MSSEDEFDILPEEIEMLPKIQGFHFWYRDVTYAIFENKSTFPYSISILMHVPASNAEYGAIIAQNVSKGFYIQQARKNRRRLNGAYNSIKNSMIARVDLSLGWEGKINDPKNS